MSTRRFVSTRHQRPNRGKSNRKVSRPRQYFRKTDCWNCGRKDHRKENCPLPGVLKCSHCLRKGVRSDQCPCQRKNKTTKANSPASKIWQTKIETSILVFVGGKSIRAILNPYTQETIIGEAVAKLVERESGTRVKKMVLRRSDSLRLESYVQMELSTRQNNVKTINGIISRSIAESSMVLGMQAIDALGFRFYVGGQEAKVRASKIISTIHIKSRDDDHRESTVRQRGRSSSQGGMRNYQRAREDDREERMPFLDKNEGRRRHEWK